MPLGELRRTARSLTRRPAYALASVLLLAIAAAANATVFSVVHSVLLRPLPFQEPSRLVAIWPASSVSNVDVAYWRDRARNFETIAAQSPGWMMAVVAEGLEPRKVTGARTSDNFFTTLGVRAALGRTLMPGDALPGKPRVAVVSWLLHQQHFGGDPGIVGRTVQVDGVPYQVVGVLGRGFEFLEGGTDLWTALPFDPASPQHQAPFSQAFGRLRRGADASSARVELQALLPGMRKELGKPADWAADLNVERLNDVVTRGVRQSLLILLGAVGLVLLLAAVNLGTLALGRSVERAREMSIRTALGASGGRLLVHLVLEQAVIGAAGAIAGAALAGAALPLLVQRLPPDVPRVSEISLDLPVFATVVAATIGVSVFFPLLTMAGAVRGRLQPFVRQHYVADTPERRRVLATLVVGQVALAIVLGTGAGLMLRSLWKLQHVDPGFESAQVLAFRLQTTSKYRDLSSGMPYFESVVERLRALAEVTHVGAIQHLPMSGYNWTTEVRPAERPPSPAARPVTAVWRFIGWDYFEAMRITRVAGRGFTQADTAGPGVAIVNEAYARRDYGAPQSALGRRVETRSPRGDEVVEIVGVVRDVRFLSLDRPARPEIYRPLSQAFMFPMAFVVRGTGAPSSLAAAVRTAAFAADPTVPVADLQPLDALIAASLGGPRLLTMLLTLFAGAGLLLVVVGVYGLVAYRVRRREREIGIRLALGSAPGEIARRVFGEGVLYVAVGCSIGLPAALALATFMRSSIFGITTHDPLTFLSVPLMIVVAALAGCTIPALRASRVDPIIALRSD